MGSMADEVYRLRKENDRLIFELSRLSNSVQHQGEASNRNVQHAQNLAEENQALRLTIDDLNADINRLTSQNAHQTKQLAALNAHIDETLGREEQTADELQRSLRSLWRENKDLREENSILSETCEKYMDETKRLQRIIESEKDPESVRMDILRAKRLVEDSVLAFERSSKRNVLANVFSCSVLSKELKQADVIAEKDKELVQLQRKYKMLEEQYLVVKDKSKDISIDYEDKCNKIVSLKHQVKELSEAVKQRDRYSEQLEMARGKPMNNESYERLKAAYESLNVAYKGSLNEKEGLRRDNEELRKELKSAVPSTLEQEVLKADLEDAKEESAELRRQNSIYEQQLEVFCQKFELPFSSFKKMAEFLHGPKGIPVGWPMADSLHTSSAGGSPSKTYVRNLSERLRGITEPFREERKTHRTRFQEQTHNKES